MDIGKTLSPETKPALHPRTNSDTIRETIQDTIVRNLWTHIEKMRPVLCWDKPPPQPPYNLTVLLKNLART